MAYSAREDTAPTVPPASARPAVAPATRRLLAAPIVPTLIRLAAPNLADSLARVTFILFDAYFVGLLGYEALAGISLVFPLLMLMQTMSAGGMGGGVASAIARALGGGRRDDANALVIHSLVIAAVMAGCFSFALLLAGPWLYSAMGGTGPALDAALTYSNIVFAGAICAWAANTLANVVRGTGAMIVSAVAVVVGEVVHLALSPTLIFGFGPFPRLGMAGAGIAVIASYSVTTVFLVGYLVAGKSLVRFTRSGLLLQRRLFNDILKVGALSSLNAAQSQMSAVVFAGLVGHLGTFAIAGYGAALRLELIQQPTLFSLGAAIVAMVGANVGAGQKQRAIQIAWRAAVMGTLISAAIGIFGAVFAQTWIGLFATEPEVQAVGATYMRIVGPTYTLLGAGVMLFSAAQGFGRMLWPFMAVSSRLAVVVIFGPIVVYALGLGFWALTVTAAASFVVVGIAMIFAFRYRVSQ